MILVAGGLVGEGELRPDGDALANARSSDQEQRTFAFLTPGVNVVEPEADVTHVLPPFEFLGKIGDFEIAKLVCLQIKVR